MAIVADPTKEPAVKVYNAVWTAAHDTALELGLSKAKARRVAVAAACEAERRYRLETE